MCAKHRSKFEAPKPVNGDVSIWVKKFSNGTKTPNKTNNQKRTYLNFVNVNSYCNITNLESFLYSKYSLFSWVLRHFPWLLLLPDKSARFRCLLDELCDTRKSLSSPINTLSLTHKHSLCSREWLDSVQTFILALICSIFSTRFLTILQHWLTTDFIAMTM